MPDFTNGKIYKIVSGQTNKIYIGATTLDLKTRMDTHIYQSKYPEIYGYTTSVEIIKYGDANIVLVEEFPCDTKDELGEREYYWKAKYGSKCVNKMNSTPVTDISIKNHKYKLKTNMCEYCGCDIANGMMNRHNKTRKHRQGIKFMYKLFEKLAD